MATDSVFKLIMTEVTKTSDTYEYAMMNDGVIVTYRSSEFIALTSNNGQLVSGYLDPRNDWCRNAEIECAIGAKNPAPGSTSTLIWTRSVHARDKAPLLAFFNKITQDKSIPYAALRRHFNQSVNNYYSLEMRFYDNSPEAHRVIAMM